MLKFLLIENFALIDHLEIEFRKGLNLITGETGSGKSILVDAVGLLAGERASQGMVREGFENARVEGIFQVSSRHPIRRALEEMGTPLEDEELVIRREISLSGANKVFVNDRMATQKQLSDLGILLADIHGQHDQQHLLQPAAQLKFLDVFGENQQIVDHLSSLFHQLQAVRSQLDQLQISEQDRLQRVDTLHYQIAEIEKLGLRPGLDLELEKERQLLNSAEQRLQASQQAYQLLYEQELSSLSQLKQSERQIEALAGVDKTYEAVLERVRDLRFQLEEIAYQLRDYTGGVEFSPARLEALEEQLSEIHKAKRKYGETVEGILGYADRIRSEIEQLAESESQLEELEATQSKLESEYFQLARELSHKRHQDVEALSEQIEQELADLNMENTVFKVQLTTGLFWL
jgi:DNA repair protein RecN (Recombination protein N)